jgi:hypothetical protein
LYSPPLHHNTPAHIFTASQWEQWNLLLCQHYSPQHIQDLDHYFINHHSHRLLGKYTENLFLWWLKQPFTDEIYGWKLYENDILKKNEHHNHNIVIYQTINGKKGDEKITVGELDFLISVDNSVIYHLELAVKFYLYIPQLHEAYGLGLNDTWSRKNQQIEKTFALGQEYFKGFKDLQYFQSLPWIKGVIHYPKYQVKNKINNGLNNECPLLNDLHHEHQQGTYELSNIATEKIRQQHGIIDFAINNEKIAPRLQTRAKLHLEVNQSWIDLALMQHH